MKTLLVVLILTSGILNAQTSPQCTRGSFVNKSNDLVRWQCGCSDETVGWSNQGDGCFHKDVASSLAENSGIMANSDYVSDEYHNNILAFDQVLFGLMDLAGKNCKAVNGIMPSSTVKLFSAVKNYIQAEYVRNSILKERLAAIQKRKTGITNGAAGAESIQLQIDALSASIDSFSGTNLYVDDFNASDVAWTARIPLRKSLINSIQEAIRSNTDELNAFLKTSKTLNENKNLLHASGSSVDPISNYLKLYTKGYASSNELNYKTETIELELIKRVSSLNKTTDFNLYNTLLSTMIKSRKSTSIVCPDSGLRDGYDRTVITQIDPMIINADKNEIKLVEESGKKFLKVQGLSYENATDNALKLYKSYQMTWTLSDSEIGNSGMRAAYFATILSRLKSLVEADNVKLAEFIAQKKKLETYLSGTKRALTTASSDQSAVATTNSAKTVTSSSASTTQAQMDGQSSLYKSELPTIGTTSLATSSSVNSSQSLNTPERSTAAVSDSTLTNSALALGNQAEDSTQQGPVATKSNDAKASTISDSVNPSIQNEKGKTETVAASLSAQSMEEASTATTVNKTDGPINIPGFTSLSQLVSSSSGEEGNKDIEIEPDENVALDSNIEVGSLVINGKLSCSNLVDSVEIKARTIYVNGTFNCGSASEKFNKKLIISLKHSSLDPKINSGYRGMIVNNKGVLNFNGDTNRAGYVRLNGTVFPGQNSITVNKAVDWKIGDKILIAPTSYDSEQGETFTIKSISGSTISLDGSFKYLHWGNKETVNTKNGPVELDQSAEVANLTRNILIRADESGGAISEADAPGAQLGGHVMVHRGGRAYVDGVEFSKMGQAGVMARYPFHWHLVGDGRGQYIKNSSIHDSFQRCVTIHGTNNTLVENNVCYNFKGHGYFFELGNEIDNVMRKNIAVHARFPSSTKYLLASDDPANSVHMRFPAVSAYWIAHPQNTITDNVAAGSVGSGFWMAFASEVRRYNTTTKEFDGLLMSTPLTANTTEFSNNTAHSTKVGMTWDGAPVFTAGKEQFNAKNPNNPEDRLLSSAHYDPSVVPVFKNLINYKNITTGIYFRGSTAVFDGGIMADNGWGFFLAFNQIVKNFTVIGESKNNGSFEKEYLYGGRRWEERQVGAVFYDGPLEMDNVSFVNYPQTQKIAKIGNADVELTATPFAPIAGSAKYTALLKNLSFLPEPYHRMVSKEYEPSQVQAWTEVNMSNAVRDLDGSFTGVAGGLVLSSSAYTSFKGCVDKSFNGNPSFFKLKVCPPTTKSMVLWLQQAGSVAEGKTPFIIRRSDGETSRPIDEWAVYDRIKDPKEIIFQTKNRLVSSENYYYEILLNDRMTGEGAQGLGVAVNSEYEKEISPIFKLTGFGSQCLFSIGGVEVKSIGELEASKVSSYYSSGNDLYFRILSQYNSGYYRKTFDYGLAKEVESGYHHLACKNKVENKIIGNIDSVKTEKGVTTISGWACDFAKKSQIDLHLYAGADASTGKGTMIGYTVANLASEAAVAFACGDASATGHRFSYKVSSDVVDQNQGKKIYFHGISTSGKANLAINGSGSFTLGEAKPVVVVTPTPEPGRNPAEKETSGKFCSGTTEILWKCGGPSSPGLGWSIQGDGCYHRDNGPSQNCGAVPASKETSGAFCNGTSEVLWRCGVVSNPGEGWVDQGKGCYHKENGKSIVCRASGDY